MIAQSPSSQTEREWLTRLLQGAGPIDGVGESSKLALTGPIYQSEQTRLYLGTLEGSARKVLVKVAVDAATGLPNVSYARRQFEILTRAAEAQVAGRALNVPRPLRLFEPEAVIVQAWIEGKGLDALLSDRTVGSVRVELLVRDAGKWLARYHKAGGLEQKPFDPGLLAAEIEAASKTSAVLARAAIQLREGRSLLAGRPMLASRLHCDFKPANVIVTNGEMFSIDFHDSEVTSVCFDLAHFLNALALDLIKGGRLTLMLRLGRLERAFLAGYASEVQPPDRTALLAFLVYDLARYLVWHAASGGLGTVVKRRLMSALLERRISALRKSLVQSGSR